MPPNSSSAEYHREWYSKRSDEQKKEKWRICKNRRKEIREWFDSYKTTLKCSECDESDFECLDFHHKEVDRKINAISNMVGIGYSKENILAEVEKCEVLCANCHRKLHYNIRNNQAVG
jgi:hypothetical protein